MPRGIEYGSMLAVEFEPHSLWYQTSITIAAYALRNGIQTTYHIFQHIPRDVEKALTDFELDVEKLQEEDILRIIDSYSVQTGIVSPKEPKTASSLTQSVKISDYSIDIAQEIKTRTDWRRLHIDDNISILSRYNQESAVIDFYRTRILPLSRAEEETFLHGILVGVHSDSFYKQFEAMCDGIIDFRGLEKCDEIEQSVRLRAMKRGTYDTRWRRLKISENGEVALAD